MISRNDSCFVPMKFEHAADEPVGKTGETSAPRAEEAKGVAPVCDRPLSGTGAGGEDGPRGVGAPLTDASGADGPLIDAPGSLPPVANAPGSDERRATRTS